MVAFESVNGAMPAGISSSPFKLDDHPIDDAHRRLKIAISELSRLEAYAVSCVLTLSVLCSWIWVLGDYCGDSD